MMMGGLLVGPDGGQRAISDLGWCLASGGKSEREGAGAGARMSSERRVIAIAPPRVRIILVRRKCRSLEMCRDPGIRQTAGPDARQMNAAQPRLLSPFSCPRVPGLGRGRRNGALCCSATCLVNGRLSSAWDFGVCCRGGPRWRAEADLEAEQRGEGVVSLVPGVRSVIPCGGAAWRAVSTASTAWALQDRPGPRRHLKEEIPRCHQLVCFLIIAEA
ncbi:hypothetical protein QBC39DRAFT_353786 [Podospora conica]|nr:hypothetical protein QBC39DRAFT_353786 [Schizothecium conicum]